LQFISESAGFSVLYFEKLGKVIYVPPVISISLNASSKSSIVKYFYDKNPASNSRRSCSSKLFPVILFILCYICFISHHKIYKNM